MKKLLKSSLIVLCILFLCACDSKEVKLEREFKDFFKDKDYTIVEVDDKIDVKSILNAYAVIKNDGSYQIEYYIFSDERSAEVSYLSNKNNFNDNFDGKISDYDGSNYSKLTMKTDTNYYIVERVENTLLYMNVENEYKDEVEELLKEMGY